MLNVINQLFLFETFIIHIKQNSLPYLTRFQRCRKILNSEYLEFPAYETIIIIIMVTNFSHKLNYFTDSGETSIVWGYNIKKWCVIWTDWRISSFNEIQGVPKKVRLAQFIDCVTKQFSPFNDIFGWGTFSQ